MWSYVIWGPDEVLVRMKLIVDDEEEAVDWFRDAIEEQKPNGAEYGLLCFHLAEGERGKDIEIWHLGEETYRD